LLRVFTAAPFFRVVLIWSQWTDRRPAAHCERETTLLRGGVNAALASIPAVFVAGYYGR
jgi:hypothetical protein